MSSDNTSMNTLPIKSKLGTLESIFIFGECDIHNIEILLLTTITTTVCTFMCI